MNSHSDHTLHFEAVNSRNRAEVEHLEVFAEQSGFIESVTQCLQEADKLELWRPIGIYDRGMLIGFAMYGYFPEPAPGQVWLDRLLIDKKGTESGSCLPCLTGSEQNIPVIPYISVCMRPTPTRSISISRSVFTSMESTIPTGSMSWYMLFNLLCRPRYNTGPYPLSV